MDIFFKMQANYTLQQEVILKTGINLNLHIDVNLSNMINSSEINTLECLRCWISRYYLKINTVKFLRKNQSNIKVYINSKHLLRKLKEKLAKQSVEKIKITRLNVAIYYKIENIEINTTIKVNSNMKIHLALKAGISYQGEKLNPLYKDKILNIFRETLIPKWIKSGKISVKDLDKISKFILHKFEDCTILRTNCYVLDINHLMKEIRSVYNFKTALMLSDFILA